MTSPSARRGLRVRSTGILGAAVMVSGLGLAAPVAAASQPTPAKAAAKPAAAAALRTYQTPAQAFAQAVVDVDKL